MFRGGAEQSGAIATRGPSRVDRSRWSVGGESNPATHPVVSQGTVYVGVGNRLLAIDAATGSADWTFEASSQLQLSPAVGPNGVYATTADNRIVAVAKDDGRESWSLGLDGKPGAPTLKNGSVYVGSDTGKLYSLSADSGTLEWKTAKGGPNPAASDGWVFVNHDTSLVAYDAESGTEKWEYSTDARMLPPAVSGNRVFAQTGTANTILACLSKTGGVEQWKWEHERMSKFPPAVGNGYVVTGISERLLAFDASTGEKQWTYEVADNNYANGVSIDAKYAFYYDFDDGALRAIRLADGLVEWSYSMGDWDDTYGGPAVTPNAIYLRAQNSVFALEHGEASSEATDDATDRRTDRDTSQRHADDRTRTQSTRGDETTAGSRREGTQTPERGFFTNGENRALAVFTGSGLTALSTLITIAGILITLYDMVRGGDN